MYNLKPSTGNLYHASISQYKKVGRRPSHRSFLAPEMMMITLMCPIHTNYVHCRKTDHDKCSIHHASLLWSELQKLPPAIPLSLWTLKFLFFPIRCKTHHVNQVLQHMAVTQHQHMEAGGSETQVHPCLHRESTAGLRRQIPVPCKCYSPFIGLEVGIIFSPQWQPVL